MIAHVFGTVAEKFNDSIVVDTGGVGYEIYVAASDFERFSVGGEAKIYTYHHVREQAEELFGFSSLAAKKLFQLLITVQGVGPPDGAVTFTPDKQFVGKPDSVTVKQWARVLAQP